MIPDSAIYDELAVIFADVFMRDVALSATLSARDVAGWDSFKQIEIVMATEERFAMKFTSAELDDLRNLGDLARIVAQRGRLPGAA
ncbi:acyl carrier protein [Methylosinus sp. Sm6]|uniref:acyl carrier protein n=1 Tax=Methylosinus sp. Sm6 TaxID=2866948 RepID=UPI001C99BC91|nr:acyl carrier protein [Methylosinus sp. Sm6]MBY6241823.1 acyl carrier protein [Methylosinus sp. Sm6]